jgi:phosphoglycolate phosphatase
MRGRAVLFDLDGTLLDTLADLGESMNEALAGLGFSLHPLASYRHFVGDGVVELARRALPEAARDEATLTACVAAMRRIYAGRWARKTRAYPGIPELLDALTARRVPFCVLSNKPDDMTRVIVAELLSSWRFAAVAGAREGIPRKPDPHAALQLARTMGIPAERFVYVGDTDTDMRTACAAAMFAVGALWGFRDATELSEAGAAALISAPQELLRFLA